MRNKLLILVDYRRNFYSTTRAFGEGFDIKKIIDNFDQAGLDVGLFTLSYGSAIIPL